MKELVEPRPVSFSLCSFVFHLISDCRLEKENNYLGWILEQDGSKKGRSKLLNKKNREVRDDDIYQLREWFE